MRCVCTSKIQPAEPVATVVPKEGRTRQVPELRVRPSLLTMQTEYESGNKQPLEDLMRAWIGIKSLPAEDPNSFHRLAGLHGAPWLLRPAVDALSDEDAYTYWGGWCHHGNVLFPTWHRLYCLMVEEALRSQVAGVTLPYWDQNAPESIAGGIPWILTREQIELDGVLVDNPLRSYTFLAEVRDEFAEAQQRLSYLKPAGYKTVRYPYSGLVGTEADRIASEAHNAQFAGVDTVALLNQNIVQWLRGPYPVTGVTDSTGVAAQYEACLDAPNYTVFSNTTSAAQYNLTEPSTAVMSLEHPHNCLHLGVGGFDNGTDVAGIVAGANGDMGENNTASFDPIFYFHHCNVDRMFWLWQVRHSKQNELEIIGGFAGTSSMDSQGPSPGYTPGDALTMTSPLLPFVKDDGVTPWTSNDVVNIEALGYTYGTGSLEGTTASRAIEAPCKRLVVRGIDRSLFEGSFIVHAWAVSESGDKIHLGMHAVLSRYNVRKCANCLTHLEVIAFFSLARLGECDLSKVSFSVTIKHRGSCDPEGLRFTCQVDGQDVKMADKLPPTKAKAPAAQHPTSVVLKLPTCSSASVAQEPSGHGRHSPTLTLSPLFGIPRECCVIS